jgi:hypothetical protein
MGISRSASVLGLGTWSGRTCPKGARPPGRKQDAEEDLGGRTGGLRGLRAIAELLQRGHVVNVLDRLY